MAVRVVGWARRDPGFIDNVRTQRTFPSTEIAAAHADHHRQRGKRRERLQPGRYHRRPRGAAYRPERQLDGHAHRDGAGAERRRQLRLRPDAGRVQGVARLPGRLQGQLGAGRTHGGRQDRQLRHGLRRLVPGPRRRPELRLRRLLLLVRRQLPRGRLLLQRLLHQRRRRSDRLFTVRVRLRPLREAEPRDPHLVAAGQPAARHRRPVLPAPGTQHRAELPDQRPHRGPGGDRAAKTPSG